MDGINRNYRVYSVLQVILTVAIFGTVCFIFSNSMQTGGVDSSSASQAVQDFLQGLLRRLGHPAAAARLTEHMVRKAAHFCEYMLEGFLLLLGVRLFSRKLRFLSWPALLGLLTALCDETIQLFYAGRGSSVTDVWIDFAGVVTGMAAALLLSAVLGALFHPRRREESAGGIRDRKEQLCPSKPFWRRTSFSPLCRTAPTPSRTLRPLCPRRGLRPISRWPARRARRRQPA